jgi:hypothetical protein
MERSVGDKQTLKGHQEIRCRYGRQEEQDKTQDKACEQKRITRTSSGDDEGTSPMTEEEYDGRGNSVFEWVYTADNLVESANILRMESYHWSQVRVGFPSFRSYRITDVVPQRNFFIDHSVYKTSIGGY